MFYVYVLKSLKSGQLYTGSTSNLRKRLSQHNTHASNWTKWGVPWQLIYYEASLEEEDCYDREKYLKTGNGKRYLKSRLKRFLT